VIWCFYGANSTVTSAPETTPVPITEPPTPPHCDVLLDYRKQCGQHGVTREQCIEKNCCWKLSLIYGVPSCYHSAPTGCDRYLPDREACGGYAGISELECTGQGCCWDEYVQPNCYRANTGQYTVLLSGPIFVTKTKIKTKMILFRFIETKTKTISSQKKRKRNKNKNDFTKYE